MQASLVILLVSVLVQDDGCKRCDYRGVVACREHDEELLAAEAEVLFCAFAAACEDCRGTLVVDCKRCDDGPGVAEAAARRAAIDAWLAPNEVEEHLGRALMRVETARFQLVVEAGPLVEKRKRIEPHALAHGIAADVEHVAARVAEHFAIQPEEYASKVRMWVWEDRRDHASVMPEFLHSTSTGEFGYLGRDPVFSSWTEPPFFDDATEVRSLFAHHAAHLLLSNAIRELWIGDLGGGWLDAAVGHWYEYELFGRTQNYCIQEATVWSNWKNGLWRAGVRERLDDEEEPFLPRLIDQLPGAMEQRDQALCWSFFDHLVATRPDALRPILEDYKRKRASRELLPERLGASLFELERAWRAWVDEVYPKRGDEPRR